MIVKKLFKMLFMSIFILLDIWLVCSLIDIANNNLDKGYSRWNMIVVLQACMDSWELPDLDFTKVGEDLEQLKTDMADVVDQLFE